MTTNEQTGDPEGGPPSQAADGEGRVSPLWLLVFGLPGLGLLAFWGTAVVNGIGWAPTVFVLLALAFAIPAVGLVLLPFHLATPSPRLRRAELVLVVWGLLIHVAGSGAVAGGPVSIPALIWAALYGCAIAVILGHGAPVVTVPADSGSGRREDRGNGSMKELLRFNKIGWAVAGPGMALGAWQARSCTHGGELPCLADERVWTFLCYASLSVGAGWVLSILSNEVAEEILWKRIGAALLVLVTTLVVAMVLALQFIPILAGY